MRGRSQVWAAVLVAALCIVARSFVFLAYEQAFFDSDQAIVGLMAKHLVEGQAFPLFYYGQAYMLVVDAWVAAPVFLLFGPTVFALHAALVLMNVAAATLLIVGFVRWGGLGPWQALAAVLFFAFAPPLTAASLIEAGANIGPFIYVPLLWMLRERPLAFGLVLGLGFLNREFTIYAVPSLVLWEVSTGELRRPGRWRFWAVAAVAAIATWQTLIALQPYTDMMGPGTRGTLIHGFADSQVGNIAERIRVAPSELPGRAVEMVRRHLPELWGARWREDAIATQGHDWLLVPLMGGLGLSCLRALWLSRRREARIRAGFGWYLAGVGACAVLGYVATRPAQDLVYRYVLLTLLLPIGIVGVLLAIEPRRLCRALAIALVAVWAGGSAVDHAAQVERYRGGREPNETRELADLLVRRGVRAAEGGYWRAYKVTYLTGERVRVASTDMVRIEAYQRAAEAEPSLLRISDEPCPGGEPASLWYLCPARP